MCAASRHLIGATVFLWLSSTSATEEPGAPPELPKVWKTFDKPVGGTLISSDGKTIAVVRGDSFEEVRLYAREGGKELARLPTTRDSLRSLTADGKHFLSSWIGRGRGKKGKFLTVGVFDLSSRKVTRTFDLLPRQRNKGHHYAVSDKALVVVADDTLITTYDLETGKHLGDFANKGHTPRMLALTPNGKWLLTAGAKNELRVWDVENRKLLHELYDHTTKVEAIAVSADGKWCASATTKPQRLWVFDRDKGKEVSRTNHFLYRVEFLGFWPGGRTLLAVGPGTHHGMNVWDWSSNKEIRGAPKQGWEDLLDDDGKKKYNVGHLHAGSMADDGTVLTAGPGDGELRLWFTSPKSEKKEKQK